STSYRAPRRREEKSEDSRRSFGWRHIGLGCPIGCLQKKTSRNFAFLASSRCAVRGGSLLPLGRAAENGARASGGLGCLFAHLVQRTVVMEDGQHGAARDVEAVHLARGTADQALAAAKYPDFIGISLGTGVAHADQR